MQCVLASIILIGYDVNVENDREINHKLTIFTQQMEASMNKEQIKGKFDQLKEKIKENWGLLSDNDVALYDGHREKFLGILEEKYGLAKSESLEQLTKMEKTNRDIAA